MTPIDAIIPVEQVAFDLDGTKNEQGAVVGSDYAKKLYVTLLETHKKFEYFGNLLKILQRKYPDKVAESARAVDADTRICRFTQDICCALLDLSSIKVNAIWKLPNDYWGTDAITGPWWLVRTNKGMLRLGWRKRVLELDWSDTPIKLVVTSDEVTKTESMVHANTLAKAAEYLTTLAPHLNSKE